MSRNLRRLPRSLCLGLAGARLLIAAVSPAQTANPLAAPAAAVQLTLEHAVSTALQRHPALRQANAAVDAAEAQLKQARASYFPQLTLTGIGKVGLSGATGALGLPGFPGSPFFRNLAGSVNAYQNVFDFGRTKRLVAAHRALLESERLRRSAEERRIVLAVRRAYLAALEAQRLLQLAQKTVEERRLTLLRAQAYFQAQLRPQLEVNLAEANLAEAEGNFIQSRNTVSTSMAALQSAMGVEDPATRYQLQEPQAQFPALPAVEELVESGLKQRPEFQALALKITALSEDVGSARSNRWPQIRGLGAGGAGRFQGTTVKPIQRHGVAGLGGMVPLFTGGRLKGELEEAEANLRGALASRDQLRQQIRLEVTQAYYLSSDLQERIRAAAEQERAAQQALRLAQGRFHLQLASFLEVMTAEVAATRAETSHAQAVFDYQRAQAELEFASGRRLVP